MARLISNVKSIEEKLQFDLREVMSTPLQSYDGRTRMPLLLEMDDTNIYLLAREMERGNLDQKNECRIPVVFHHPYFVLSEAKDKPLAFKDIADALRNMVSEGTIIVDEELPCRIYHGLQEYFDPQVEFRRKLTGKKLVVYAKKRQDVLSQFSKDGNREKLGRIAGDLTDHLGTRDALEEHADTGQDNRFVLLDKLLEEENIQGVLASSPMNFQEVAGINGEVTRKQDVLALYLRDEASIYIIATDEIELQDPGKAVNTFDSKTSVLRQLAGTQAIGFEEDSLDIGRFLEIERSGCRLKEASNLLRRWREDRACQDLPYFIIAAQISKYAIEETLLFVRKSIDANVPITEKTVERKYVGLLGEFVKKNKIPVRIETYHTGIHAGKRSIYPSRPIEYPLDNSIKSLRIDAGIFVIDNQGLIRACSDIARTLVLTKEGEEIYRFMEKVVLGLIQTIKVGDSGEDVYWRGIQKLTEGEPRIRNLNMMPGDFSLMEGYDRDIGHLMERQESFTFGLCRGNRNRLKRGMIGCVEFHWLFKEHGMTAEDTFVVTDKGGIPISR